VPFPITGNILSCESTKPSGRLPISPETILVEFEYALYEMDSRIIVPLFGLKTLKIIEKFPVLPSIIFAVISLIDN
jgi:hypothetical protein